MLANPMANANRKLHRCFLRLILRTNFDPANLSCLRTNGIIAGRLRIGMLDLVLCSTG